MSYFFLLVDIRFFLDMFSYPIMISPTAPFSELRRSSWMKHKTLDDLWLKVETRILTIPTKLVLMPLSEKIEIDS